MGQTCLFAPKNALAIHYNMISILRIARNVEKEAVRIEIDAFLFGKTIYQYNQEEKKKEKKRKTYRDT